MLEHFRRFLKDEGGQDLIEYTLLMAFLALSCMWFFSSMHGPVSTIVTKSNAQISKASSVANGN